MKNECFSRNKSCFGCETCVGNCTDVNMTEDSNCVECKGGGQSVVRRSASCFLDGVDEEDATRSDGGPFYKIPVPCRLCFPQDFMAEIAVLDEYLSKITVSKADALWDLE